MEEHDETAMVLIGVLMIIIASTKITLVSLPVLLATFLVFIIIMKNRT